MENKIRVLIVDDVRILRNGIKAILENNEMIEVAGCASNGKEAYELCKTNSIDVVLMDMRMPEFDGAYGCNKIKSENKDIKVLILTTFDDDVTVQKAMESGADGYILKEMADESIINSIISVYSGINVLANNIYNNICYKYNNNAVNQFDLHNISFTERELKLMCYITQGLNNKEISEAMFLAEGTVRNNISKLLEKLHLKDRTALAVYVVKHRLDQL